MSLRSLGVNVTGRSHRLRINYRTTHEILQWSASLLSGQSLDDMDGGTETLAGHRSVLSGGGPELRESADRAEEIADLVKHIAQWVDGGVESSEIGVAVRYLQLGKEIAHALAQADLPVRLLGTTQATGDGVSIGTMHRMKGLEFRLVAVAGVTDSIVPLASALTPAAVDAQQHREDLLGELSLLFVACTRA
ncbi:3'-5' exonuclease [Streptomyces virginiae]|uniref:3'-5' exonuclease n=1 Tax=Streptomyces virginiae TaxID=1961 RepID=UPI0035D7A2C2